MRAVETKFVPSEAPRVVSPEAAAAASTLIRPTVALVDWSQLIEDYLDNIGVSFESFCKEMTGGWMFGYVDALRLAGVRTVLFCVSARVRETTKVRHAPTGALICVLPAPRPYRALRRRLLNPYASSVEEAVGETRWVRRAFWAALKELSPYLSTPLMRLARELRRERCGAVLCQDYEHGRLDVCLLAGRLTGRPVFATFQGGDGSAGRLERLTRRAALRACDGLVIATGSEAARVETRYGVAAGKVARVFNPLDSGEWRAVERSSARRALGIPEAACVVAWHGRVDYHRKGLDVLLEAWRRVTAARPGVDLRLLLVGTGNNADVLREQIAREQPPGLMWIDRYVNDKGLIRLYLSAADVYAFPSRHEGFPVAPLEAMACGLPLVASAAHGVADILEGGEAAGGIQAPVGDASAFAAALGRLIDDGPLRQRLGERARRRIEEGFSLETVGAQLRRFIFGGEVEQGGEPG